MNRIRCTKLVVLAVLLSIFAYLILKDDAVPELDHPRRIVNLREIDSMLPEG